MNFLLEYKYYIFAIIVAAIGVVTYSMNIMNEEKYQNFQTGIETQYLKIQSVVSTSSGTEYSSKSIKDAIIDENGKIRGLSSNGLFDGVQIAENPTDLEIITGYDKSNKYFFVGRNQDNTLNMDLNGNNLSGESSDIVKKVPSGKFSMKFIDTQRGTGGKVIKKKLSDIKKTDSTVNRGWGVDYILYIFGSEKEALSTNEKYLPQGTLTLLDDGYGIYGNYGVLVPFLNGKDNAVTSGNTLDFGNENCIFNNAQFTCFYN